MSAIKRFKGDIVVFAVMTLVLILVGLVLIPGLSPHGPVILNYIIAVLLLAYVFFFLLKKMIKSRQRSIVLVLCIVEFIVMFLAALGLIFNQLKIINFGSVSQMVGVALWIRGSIELFRGFYIVRPEGKKNSSVIGLFFLYLAIVTAGCYLFFVNPITNNAMLWAMAVIAFLAAVVSLVLFITCLPKRKAAKKTKDSKNSKKSKNNKDEK